MKTIKLEINGCRPNNLTGENYSGIYIVYTGISNPDKTCTLKKLIYIGESEDISERITGRISGHSHNKWDEWKKQLQDGEKLYFCYAKANKEDRLRAEAALIHKYQPVCNKEFTGKFDDFADTKVEISGVRGFLSTFVVEKQK